MKGTRGRSERMSVSQSVSDVMSSQTEIELPNTALPQHRLLAAPDLGIAFIP